jgi:hypothetical protein
MFGTLPSWGSISSLQNRHRGTPNYHRGTPNYHRGTPNYHRGTPNYIADPIFLFLKEPLTPKTWPNTEHD